MSKVHSKVAGTLINLNDMRLKQMVPKLDANVVSSFSSIRTGISQYSQLASNIENMHASSKKSTYWSCSSIRGSGFVYLRDTELSFR